MIGGGGGNRLKYFLCKCNPEAGGLLFAFEIMQFPSSLGNHKLTQIAKVVIKICEHEVRVPGLLGVGVSEAQGSPVGGYSDFCVH